MAQLRVVVESLNDAGEITGTETVMVKQVHRPDSIIDLGFRHSEQIALLKQIQQQLLNEQSIYLKEDLPACPNCGDKLYKSGHVKADFHAVFTDHKVSALRQICKSCKWASIPSVRSLFGSSSHPDLVKMQCEFGASRTFRNAQKALNLIADAERSVNSHDRIKRMAEAVGQHIGEHPDPIITEDVKPAMHLYVQVDGGHVPTIDPDKRSFEVMTSVVFDAKNIKRTSDKIKQGDEKTNVRKELTSKHCAASAVFDNQDAIKKQTFNAAIRQGMTSQTKITALCDGAQNCWSVVDFLEPHCESLERILDWFHIGMKFQNIRLGNEEINKQLTGAKWYLWHGSGRKAIERLQAILDILKEKKNREKIKALIMYIENNLDFIVNYQHRQDAGLVFTSQMAESTVESLINQRCKGKQHMRWSREGIHALLQIRAAIDSNDWNVIWEKHVMEAVYLKAA